MREAEELVGHEFVDEEDLVTALDEIAELGARNVLITHETGCYALLREDRNEVRLRARAPELDAVSRIGAGDTLACRASSPPAWAGSSFEDAVRTAVAAGAASVLETGPGALRPARSEPPDSARHRRPPRARRVLDRSG